SEVAEHEEMRAAARTADLRGEPTAEPRVESRAGECADPVDRIAAALATGRGGRFEGDVRLLRDDRLERRLGGIDRPGESHVVDDAGGLEVAGDGHEAALAEVQDAGVQVEPAVGACGERHGHRARVERMAASVESHEATLSWRAGPTQADAWRATGELAMTARMNVGDSVVLVTGGASGLGEATVRMVVAAGGKAVILDRPDSAGDEVATALGTRATFVAADVTSGEQVTAAIAQAIEHFGTLHAAVNCAGIGAAMRTVTKQGPMPLEIFAKVIAVNLTGTFNVIRLAAAQMARNTPNAEGERGVVVNTASAAAFDGQIGQAAYSASKGGIVGMTLPIARDLSSLGIRVVTI